jgi:hypothetical protein
MHFSKIASLLAVVAVANAISSPLGLFSIHTDRLSRLTSLAAPSVGKREAAPEAAELYSSCALDTKRDILQRCIGDREAEAEPLFECAASAEKRMINGRCVNYAKEKRDAEAESEEIAKRTCLRSVGDEKRCTCLPGRSAEETKRCIYKRDVLVLRAVQAEAEELSKRCEICTKDCDGQTKKRCVGKRAAEAEAEELAKRICLRSFDEKRCTCIGDGGSDKKKRCIDKRQEMIERAVEAEVEQLAKREAEAESTTCLRSLDEKRCTCIVIPERDISMKEVKRCIISREALMPEIRECASAIGKRMIDGRCVQAREDLYTVSTDVWGTCPTGKRDLEGRCI